MNVPEVIKEISFQCDKNLKVIYEACCDEYKKRLTELWEFYPEEVNWIPSDRSGELLIVIGEYTISMSDVIVLVENAVTFDDYIEWYDYNENFGNINLRSWFVLGARPEIFQQ